MEARIRLAASVGILAAVGCLALAGCTGEVALESSTSATGGAGGSGPDGCPAELPAAGSVCHETLTCAYGDPDCPTYALCTGSWEITSAHCVPTCPANPPTPGDPCGSEGAQCTYQPETCGPGFVCSGGQWVPLPQPGCAAMCPVDEPKPGDPCNPCCSGECSYAKGCGVDTATCIGGGWAITIGECTSGPCQVLDAAACNAAPQCRWLEPGCGTMPLAHPGCFDAGDCQAAGCPNGGVCQTVSVDPCPAGDCNACSVDVNVCMWLGG